MAREFAKKFYNSQAWHNARGAYMMRVHGLCERCLSAGLMTPAEIVHHKEELTPQNINDPRVSLSPDNLEALCRPCHAKEHEETYIKTFKSGKTSKKRWRFSKTTGEFFQISPP